MLVKQNINAKAVRFPKKTFLKWNTTLMERKKKNGMKKWKKKEFARLFILCD